MEVIQTVDKLCEYIQKKNTKKINKYYVKLPSDIQYSIYCYAREILKDKSKFSKESLNRSNEILKASNDIDILLNIFFRDALRDANIKTNLNEKVLDFLKNIFYSQIDTPFVNILSDIKDDPDIKEKISRLKKKPHDEYIKQFIMLINYYLSKSLFQNYYDGLQLNVEDRVKHLGDVIILRYLLFVDMFEQLDKYTGIDLKEALIRICIDSKKRGDYTMFNCPDQFSNCFIKWEELYTLLMVYKLSDNNLIKSFLKKQWMSLTNILKLKQGSFNSYKKQLEEIYNNFSQVCKGEVSDNKEVEKVFSKFTDIKNYILKNNIDIRQRIEDDKKELERTKNLEKFTDEFFENVLKNYDKIEDLEISLGTFVKRKLRTYLENFMNKVPIETNLETIDHKLKDLLGNDIIENVRVISKKLFSFEELSTEDFEDYLLSKSILKDLIKYYYDNERFKNFFKNAHWEYSSESNKEKMIIGLLLIIAFSLFIYLFNETNKYPELDFMQAIKQVLDDKNLRLLE